MEADMTHDNESTASLRPDGDPGSRHTATKVGLSILLARKAPVAVILRRGPSQRSLLLRWDLRDDRIEAGQWLAGQIRFDQSDLSPRGDRLLYFATCRRGGLASWTAISRPPYLTALAFWPKHDMGGGGGLFVTQTEVAIDHKASELAFWKDTTRPGPAWLKVGSRQSMRSVSDSRWARDGWRVGGDAAMPTRTRACPAAGDIHLTLRRVGGGTSRPYWEPSVDVTLVGRSIQVDLGHADWADWCPAGDLLLARQGRIHRFATGRHRDRSAGISVVDVADLNGLGFEARKAPPAALDWHGAAPAGVRIPMPIGPSALAPFPITGLEALFAAR
jgi:hypothetical protein